MMEWVDAFVNILKNSSALVWEINLKLDTRLYVFSYKKDRQTERQKDRKTERQKDRKAERQKDRKTEISKNYILRQIKNKSSFSN